MPDNAAARDTSASDPSNAASPDEALATAFPRFLGLAVAAPGGVGMAVVLASRVSGNAAISGVAAWVILGLAVGGIAIGIAVVRIAARRHAGIVAAMEQKQQRLADKVKRQETKLRKLERSSRQSISLLLHMVDGIVVLSPENRILLVNSSARRLLGLRARENLVGRPIGEVIRIPEVIRALRRLPNSDRAQIVTTEVGCSITDDYAEAGSKSSSAAAEFRPVMIRVDRLDVGERGNTFLTIQDQTDARRMERVRREFVANVSHELKTPLAAIKGYAETVQVAVEDDPQAATHFMSQIQVQCVALENLIADMMELARAQAGRKQLKLERISLRAAVVEAIESNLPIADQRRIELNLLASESPERRRERDSGEHLIRAPEASTTPPPSTDITPGIDTQGRASPSSATQTSQADAAKSGDPAMILGDRKAAVTIANNLIGNAIRYSHPGGAVDVRIDREGDLWRLSVQDDGPGIDPAEHDRIFERFYRVDKTRQANRGGTGLGLSIVKHLSLAQGGEVSLDSKPGEGARFEVRLPAVSLE